MKTPIHLWIVGGLSLLWNAAGGYDYVMTQTQNPAYLEIFSPEQLAYFQAFPTWMEFAWAIGVWFSVFGSLLLLLRSRFAVGAFTLSLAGLIGAAFYSFVVSDPSSLTVNGNFALYFTLAIAVVLFGLLAYARAMSRRGVLR